jgi:hypothetical protein
MYDNWELFTFIYCVPIKKLSWSTQSHTPIIWHKNRCAVLATVCVLFVHFVQKFLIFIHSIDMCRMQWFLAVLRSFLHSPLLYTFSCHSSPPSVLPSSLTSSCHLFLGLPLSLVDYKFMYTTHLGILFSSILCTCPNQCNLIVSGVVDC